MVNKKRVYCRTKKNNRIFSNNTYATWTRALSAKPIQMAKINRYLKSHKINNLGTRINKTPLQMNIKKKIKNFSRYEPFTIANFNLLLQTSTRKNNLIASQWSKFIDKSTGYISNKLDMGGGDQAKFYKYVKDPENNKKLADKYNKHINKNWEKQSQPLGVACWRLRRGRAPRATRSPSSSCVPSLTR